MSYYQTYYQGERWKPKEGVVTKRFCYDKAKYGMNSNRAELHKIVLEFLEKNGIETTIFRKYRNNRDCQSRINAMFTTLRKEGLYDEFIEYYRTLKGE